MQYKEVSSDDEERQRRKLVMRQRIVRKMALSRAMNLSPVAEKIIFLVQSKMKLNHR